jgi:hypothetical protein
MLARFAMSAALQETAGALIVQASSAKRSMGSR